MAKLTLKPELRAKAIAAGKLAPAAPPPPSPPPARPGPRPSAPTRFECDLAWIAGQFVETEEPLLPRYPFAIGIREALLADPRLKPEADPVAIAAGLARLTRSGAYRRALAKEGARRYDVGGADAGPVSEEARAHATKLLDERAAKSTSTSKEGA